MVNGIMDIFQVIEIFAFATGIAYVVLEILQKNAMWVVGILTGAACAYSFAVQRNWGMTGLNIYYVVMSVIGLIQWRKDGEIVEEGLIHLRALPKKTAVIGSPAKAFTFSASAYQVSSEYSSLEAASSCSTKMRTCGKCFTASYTQR